MSNTTAPMPDHIFRQYDIRGVADRDLTDAVVYRIGRGLARMLSTGGNAPHIVVGRDCRRSGPRIYAALLGGLTEGGANVTNVGVGPTPLVYFAAHHFGSDGAVMITGSHNPGEDNGLKIMRGKSSFFGEDIRALHQLVASADFETVHRGSVETVPIDEDYLSALRGRIKLEPNDLKVVVDAGNGAAGPLALRAFRAVGIDPVALYCDMNGSFPNHHPDPTVEANLEDLIATVKKEDAVVGLAFDGDGDRLGVVDRTGEIIWGDRLLALFARDVLRARPGATVLGEVKCSQSLYDDIKKHGGHPIMWKTGHSFIKTKMREEKVLLAGEMSGHFFFADRYFGYDDGIYAALRVLEILAREGKTVAELLSDIPKSFGTPELRVACDDALKFDVVSRVLEIYRAREEVVDIDGVRIQYADGAWGLVRASNTGALLVLRFEASTPERRDEIRAEVEETVREVKAQLSARTTD